MKKISTYNRLLLLLCIFAIIASCCGIQAEISVDRYFDSLTSHSGLQMPKAHTQCSDILDESQWIVNNDDASHSGISDKKTIFSRKNDMRLFGLHRLLTGLGALSASLFAGVFHDSSCSTHGLLCMLSFILDADGKKDNTSFLSYK